MIWKMIIVNECMCPFLHAVPFAMPECLVVGKVQPVFEIVMARPCIRVYIIFIIIGMACHKCGSIECGVVGLQLQCCCSINLHFCLLCHMLTCGMGTQGPAQLGT